MNIIAVDDEELPLKLLVDSIRKAMPSTEIHSFQNSCKALDFLKTNRCDIAFLDIEMCGMTGLDFSRKLKELSPQTNIIFVTGHAEYAVDAFKVGASDYLLKPPTPESVLQALDQLRNPIKNDSENRIRIRCFGNFDNHGILYKISGELNACHLFYEILSMPFPQNLTRHVING